MIQVLERAFNMLEHIGAKHAVRLTDLAKAATLNTTTAGNILATLRDLGYLSQNDKSEYMLSGRFHKLSSAAQTKDLSSKVAEENIKALCEQVNEAAVLSLLVDGERYQLAEARPDRSITVTNTLYQGASLFDTVTGRVLLAYLSSKELQKLLKRHNFPLSPQWRDATTKAQLLSILSKIRTDRIGFITKGDVAAAGVPIFNSEGMVWGAVGVYLPKIRFSGKHRTHITGSLKATAQRMQYQLFPPASSAHSEGAAKT
ncbi:MAG: helix-turn-helix domain-containing protein [Planctomycetes bacterium]|nr:helix-turn-helix domain-containing protein [Planctomycetota bacterium]